MHMQLHPAAHTLIIIHSKEQQPTTPSWQQGVTLVGTTVNVAASASATSCAPFAVAVFVLLMLALGSLWVLEAQARLLARLSASVQQPEEPSTSEHLLPQSNPAAAHSTSSSDVRAPLLLQRQGPQQQQLLHQGIEADHCSWPLMPYVIGMGWAALSGVCAGGRRWCAMPLQLQSAAG